MPLPQEISTSGCLGGSRTMRSLLVALHAMAASSSASCSSSAAQPTEQASAHAAASMAASSSAASPTSALQPTEQAIASKASSSGAPHPGETGIDVIDELGCVSGSLLHADALRKTYGRSLRFNLQTTQYMKPQETWGRMPAKLLCGDFYQLPPVPASASLLAPTSSDAPPG